jgi:protoporphyrinogen oxidase
VTQESAVIIGAGPAGLTAALELLRGSHITTQVFDCDIQVGGISKTVVYRGNRMDLGGHRFFSKSDWVMRWWQEILPIDAGEAESAADLRLSYQGDSRDIVPAAHAPNSPDAVMLVRRRLSRIFYRRRFFDYPLKLNTNTLRNMGLIETLRIGFSYGQSKMIPRFPESSLEDFFVNRFGDRLYHTFFKDYTEKVWGVPCQEISAEWGAQRIKALSVTKAVKHALTSSFRSPADTAQKRTETSLIERFLYPKLGPGQMWEEVARQIASRGGGIHLRHQIVGIERNGTSITAVTVRDGANGVCRRVPCDYLISTMPVRDLAAMLLPDDAEVIRVANLLPYRDFMTVGLLVKRMKTTSMRGASPLKNGMPSDNWIYIQEPDVKIGRLQIFNNWSPALVSEPDTIWLGLEYFCREGDELWSMQNARFIDFAAAELEKIGLIDRRDVLDGTVVRVAKAYPAYFGVYNQFGRVRTYLEQFSNLYPIGRNGMHRYNNQDHSMLAARGAVAAIINGGRGKSDIWRTNVEDVYHEEIEDITEAVAPH